MLAGRTKRLSGLRLAPLKPRLRSEVVDSPQRKTSSIQVLYRKATSYTVDVQYNASQSCIEVIVLYLWYSN
jgi:hypothetical protein